VAHFAGIRNFFKVAFRMRNGVCIAHVSKEVSIALGDSPESDSGFILIRNEDILLSPSAFESSALNNFEGAVLDLYPSRSGMEVVLDIGIVLHAQVSRESALKLKLVQGKKVWAHFKASSVKVIAG
jgi:molybdopterin-binding protein